MSANIEALKKKWEEQPMLRPKIESVKVNVSLGVAGPPLQRAKTIIRNITGQEPADTIAKNTWRAWGVRKGQPMGCTVTIRGNHAYEMLMRFFHAKNYQLKERSIDRQGNFGFGITEHIDIPGEGADYDPNLGIIGMDVTVQMSRAGYRVKKRKYRTAKVGRKHTLTPEDTKAWLVDKYDIELI